MKEGKKNPLSLCFLYNCLAILSCVNLFCDVGLEQGNTDGPLPVCGDPDLCRTSFHWFGKQEGSVGLWATSAFCCGENECIS